MSAPEERQVTPELTVSYRGQNYDVSTVPGVMVGQKLLIARNPWRDDAAQVVLFDADGYETYHVVARVEENTAGFRADAPVIGEQYARHADTPAQTAAKEIEQITMGADTLADAEAARKAKRLPFGGRIDPYRHTDDSSLPFQLPKPGTALDVRNPVMALPPITHVDAAVALKAMLKDQGHEWQRDDFGWLQENYPSLTRDDLPAIADDLIARRSRRSALKLVGGVA